MRTTAQHFLLLWDRAHVFVGCNQDVRDLIELLLFLCLSAARHVGNLLKPDVSGSDMESSYPNTHGWVSKDSLTSINIKFMLIHISYISSFQ